MHAQARRYESGAFEVSQDDGMRAASADAGSENSAHTARQELRDLRARMGVIREEVTADVERKWATPYRTPDVFDLKVTTRLTGHQEYRSLRVRVAQVEAVLAGQPHTLEPKIFPRKPPVAS